MAWKKATPNCPFDSQPGPLELRLTLCQQARPRSASASPQAGRSLHGGSQMLAPSNFSWSFVSGNKRGNFWQREDFGNPAKTESHLGKGGDALSHSKMGRVFRNPMAWLREWALLSGASREFQDVCSRFCGLTSCIALGQTKQNQDDQQAVQSRLLWLVWFNAQPQRPSSSHGSAAPREDAWPPPRPGPSPQSLPESLQERGKPGILTYNGWHDNWWTRQENCK